MKKTKGLALSVAEGFTFIEILVVITIIATLTAIGAVSYIQVSKQSRDARRKGDLKAIQQAMEQFYADNASKYPTDTGSLVTGGYLPAYPADPKGCDSYILKVAPTETAYTICGDLETVGSFTCAEEDYCVSQLQR